MNLTEIVVFIFYLSSSIRSCIQDISIFACIENKIYNFFSLFCKMNGNEISTNKHIQTTRKQIDLFRALSRSFQAQQFCFKYNLIVQSAMHLGLFKCFLTFREYNICRCRLRLLCLRIKQLKMNIEMDNIVCYIHSLGLCQMKQKKTRMIFGTSSSKKNHFSALPYI